MKNISAVSDNKDIVTVEYVDNVTAAADKSDSFTINNTVNYPLLALTAYGRSWQSDHVVNVADVGIEGYGTPVSSGGNYTDKNGQQWICDELIVNADGTGKIIKHTKTVRLSSQNGYWKRSNDYSVERYYTPKHYFADDWAYPHKPFFTHFDRNKDGKEIGGVTVANDAIGFAFAEYGTTTVDDFKLFLDNNDVIAIYSVITPSETELKPEQATALQPLIDKYGAFTAYFMSTQDGIPAPENPVEIVSAVDLHRVSVPIESIGDSGSVTVTSCGKNLLSINQSYEISEAAYVWQLDSIVINAGTYTVSFQSSIAVSYSSAVAIVYQLEGELAKVEKGFIPQKGLNTYTFTVDKPIVSIRFYANNLMIGATISEFQLEEGSTATEYEPYKSTTTKIATALPLRGIPVSSGGNYTDKNGQEWVCDTIDYNYTEAVKTQRITVIDSYNGETVGDTYISTTGGLDVGATVIYPAETVTETLLTADEINQLRNLETFDGITNIYNSENADMSVEYLTSKAVSKAVMPIITVLRGDNNA